MFPRLRKRDEIKKGKAMSTRGVVFQKRIGGRNLRGICAWVTVSAQALGIAVLASSLVLAQAPQERVNFGIADQYDNGESPSVALTSSGMAIEVHKSQNNDGLYYRVGQATIYDVTWGPSQQYDHGQNPAVAVTDNGVVVEVHKSQNNNTIFYHVGRLQGQSIVWGPSVKYDDGVAPRVAVSADGQVVEVHGSENHPTLWSRVGRISGQTINWGPSSQFDHGLKPSISMAGQGQLIEVHQSENHPTIYYRTGKLSGNTITWGTATQYDDGVSPTVALSPSGIAIEVHESQNHPTLWQRTGTILANGTVAWTSAVQYDSGRSPSVAFNSAGLAIQVHPSERTSGLWYSTSLVVDRARWMEHSPSIAGRAFRDIVVPGAHDCGAYSMSTDKCPCNDAHALIGSITRPWSEAQAEDFGSQLRGGVRYFDVRPYDDGKDFHAYHDVIGANVSTMFDEARSFLDSVNKELVVIKVSHFCGRGGDEKKFDHPRLQNLISTKLGPYLDKESAPLSDRKVGDIVAHGPRVYIVYDDDSANNKDGQGFHRYLNLFDSYANTSSMSGMVNDQTKKLEANAASKTPEMFLLSWTLTITGLGSAIDHPTLHDLANVANSKLGSYVKMYQGRRVINVLYVDFYADSRATDLAITLNR